MCSRWGLHRLHWLLRVTVQRKQDSVQLPSPTCTFFHPWGGISDLWALVVPSPPSLPSSPPPQFQVVFTIPNQRLWISISKSLCYTLGCFGLYFQRLLSLKMKKINFLLIMCFQGLTCRVRWAEVHPLPWEISFMMSVCTRAGQHLWKSGLQLSRATLQVGCTCTLMRTSSITHPRWWILGEEQHPLAPGSKVLF